MPCALCGSWDHNRSACPLGRAMADREMLDLIELGTRLDGEQPEPEPQPPCDPTA